MFLNSTFLFFGIFYDFQFKTMELSKLMRLTCSGIVMETSEAWLGLLQMMVQRNNVLPENEIFTSFFFLIFGKTYVYFKPYVTASV